MIPSWVRYSFNQTLAVCDICGKREPIAATNKKYLEKQLKEFAKKHEKCVPK